jgi:hypothetical protein
VDEIHTVPAYQSKSHATIYSNLLTPPAEPRRVSTAPKSNQKHRLEELRKTVGRMLDSKVADHEDLHTAEIVLILSVATRQDTQVSGHRLDCGSRKDARWATFSYLMT